jgi:hypothetical protein
MRTYKLFRYLWRTNAVLIFLATGGVCMLGGGLLLSEAACNAHRRKVAEAAPAVAADPRDHLYLGPMSRIEGSDVLRAELLAPRQEAGLSSGGYGTETRNIMFLDARTNEARWLLPDASRIITDETVVWAGEERSRDRRQIAVVLLAKPKGVDREVDVGTLLILEPQGRTIRTVAEGVRTLSHASLADDHDILIVYERGRRYVRSIIDAASFATRSEGEVSVPELK